jgi:phage portal protein BeeE
LRWRWAYPPELLGDHENATYSNYQEARASFYTETVLPRMDRLRDALNRWLAVKYGDQLYIDYDRDDIEALAEDRAALWDRARMAGMMAASRSTSAQDGRAA